MTTHSLWPTDIAQIPQEQGPLKLLKEQASFLSEETKGLVAAEVRAEKEAIDGMFSANFYLVGPAINYRYLLFNIYYPLGLYPARIGFEPGIVGSVTVKDDEELEKELQHMFEHEQTRQVVGAIIARSKQDG